MCLMALTMNAQRSAVPEFNAGSGVSQDSSSQNLDYVDLDLPSGTLWKNVNEKGIFYTYDEAVSRFGDKLPTREQWEELTSYCQWEWNGNGYKITGPNSKSITLPAAGFRNCSGSVNFVGSIGYYWSSTPNFSKYAWDLNFSSTGVHVGNGYRCNSQSVRLVR